MANSNKNVKNYKVLYLIGILIIIIVIVINAIVNKSKEDVEYTEEEMPIEQEIEIKNNNIIERLQGMEERDRMEYYFGEFLEYIENKEYENAYDLLYEDFKNQYFPTEKSFEEYVSTLFSEMTSIEHENIERNGDVYVLWIYISDALNGKPGDKKKMNIVIKENDYNDFVLSFSVI